MLAAILVSMFKGAIKFFTSKLGVAVIFAAAILFCAWRIYAAGAASTLEDANKKVAKAEKNAKAQVDEVQKKLDEVQKKLDALEKEKTDWREGMALAVAEAKAEQDETLDRMQKRLDELQKQKNAVKTIVKEVPIYVTEKANSQCALTDGFVWLYDSTLQAGAVPRSRPEDVDRASKIALSDFAYVASENNSECSERGEIIRLWQEWYARSKAAHDALSAKANQR